MLRKEDGSVISLISKEESISIIKSLSEHLKNNYHLDYEQIMDLVKQKEYSPISIPVSIFAKELSPTEAIVKYLKENEGLSNIEIAELLANDEKNVWASYSRVKAKSSTKFIIKSDDILIPVSYFKDEKMSTLECLISYLKNQKHMKGKEISKLTNKKLSTIFTALKRSRERK